MISEKRFAVRSTSFWNNATPLADRFMRQQNANLNQYLSPLASAAAGGTRGVINELAFRIFGEATASRLAPEQLEVGRVSNLAHQAVDFIRNFRESGRAEVVVPDGHSLSESVEIARRLAQFFPYWRKAVGEQAMIVAPQFPGVGILDSCAGDVLYGDTLIEVKAAERLFRVVDLRQLLVYCALNHAANSHTIKNVGLVNPRMGNYFVLPVGWLVREVSGTGPSELFGEIVNYLSESGLGWD